MRIKEEIKGIEEEYIRERDWKVKENANEIKSYGNFLSYILDNILGKKEILQSVFSPEVTNMHFNSDIHIHKLPHSLYIPYCAGWSYSKLLEKGLKTPTLVAKPPKHLDAALFQLSNFAYLVAQEFSGACAWSAFDLFSAPFVKYDNLDLKDLKQKIQAFLFELNYPTRLGYQTPFTNITLMLDTSNTYLEREVFIGGKVVGKAGDFLDEAIKIVKALLLNYNEGDSHGAPFTFPIPTIMITKNFDWNGTKWGDLTDLIFENLALRGTIYILNGYVADVDSTYSMCCRLTIETEKLPPTLDMFLGRVGRSYVKGMWATPESTGSIGVVTINLPRIAILSKGEKEKFEQMLLEKLEAARKALTIMRKRYEKSLKAGLMPITSYYLGHFNFHYSTFGLVGLPEAAANFLRIPDLWEKLDKNEIDEATKFMKYVVSFVNKYAQECQSKDGVLYNVEEVPAESVAYKFALADYKMFYEKVKKKEVFIPFHNSTPFYSNSIAPYYALLPIPERVRIESEVQKEFSGGVMMHLFLYEAVDPKALKELVKKIVTQTEIVYFSITPTITVCRKCGKSYVGVYESCPNCKSITEIWSRIVGYYRPVHLWNIGKKTEFEKRVQYGNNFELKVTEELKKWK